MPIQKEVLEQIDAALDLYSKHRAQSKHEDLSDRDDPALLSEIGTVISTTIERLAPPESQYVKAPQYTLASKIGVLRAAAPRNSPTS